LGNDALIVIARLPSREASQSHKGRSPENAAFKPYSIRETRLPRPTAKAVRLASMGIGFLWIIRLLLPYGFVLEFSFLKPLDYESA
jgi:hypothetical protein